MNIMPTLRLCRDKLLKAAQVAERHAHLGYLTIGTIELRGLESLACGGCLFIGVIVDLMQFNMSREN